MRTGMGFQMTPADSESPAAAALSGAPSGWTESQSPADSGLEIESSGLPQSSCHCLGDSAAAGQGPRSQVRDSAAQAISRKLRGRGEPDSGITEPERL